MGAVRISLTLPIVDDAEPTPPRRRRSRGLLDRVTTRMATALLRAGAQRRPQPDHDHPGDDDEPTRAPRTPEQVVTHCVAYLDDARVDDVSLDAATDLARAGAGFVWVDLSEPTAEEFAGIATRFDLPDLAVEDAVTAHQRPKLESYDDLLFVVLKPAVYIDSDEVVDIDEVALFVGPRFVVSVRHGPVPMLDQVRAEATEDSHPVPGPIGVLHRIADLVVDEYENALVGIDDDVDEVELQVFADAGDERDDHSTRIYKLKREIAEFRRAVAPLSVALDRLVEGDLPGLDDLTRTYFRDVHDHVLRAAEAIDAHDRLLSDILQADFARLAARQSQVAVRQNEIAARQNEDMRRISAWAAIGLVPTAIAGIYGMNFADMPELRWEYGYFTVLAVMAVLCLLLYRAFRRNGWL